MRSFILFLFFIFGAKAATPTLTMTKFDLGTNIMASVWWSEFPITVLHGTNLIVDAGAQDGRISVACGISLVVTITADVGTTNEVEASVDLKVWEPSNVRFVSDGSTIKYYVPPPHDAGYYRLRKR